MISLIYSFIVQKLMTIYFNNEWQAKLNGEIDDFVHIPSGCDEIIRTLFLLCVHKT